MNHIPAQAQFHQLKRLNHTKEIVALYTLQLQPAPGKDLTPFVLPADLQLKLTQLLHTCRVVFQNPQGLPPPRSHDHAIPLVPNALPVKVKPYRYPHSQKSEIERIVADMLAEGIILPSTSPFSSSVLLVKKKDGSWRFCTYYRALNAVTVKDSFLMPTVTECNALYAKLSKCSFGKMEVDYLGHVSHQGVQVDESKVQRQSVYAREMQAILAAVSKFWHYLLGHQFSVAIVAFRPDVAFSETEQCSGRLQQLHELWYWDDRIVISVGSPLIQQLLHLSHDSLIGGHGGYKKTLGRLAAQFFWKGMSSSIRNYVKAYNICQQAKYSTQPPAGLLEPLPIPSHIWQDISMDFIIGLPISHGCSVILVVIDRLSKFAHFIPLPTDYTAPKVVEAFVQTVVSVHGILHSIISDRDKVFTSKFWEQYCGTHGITLARSSAYHPESDGQTEVLNRCLEMYLRCYTQENHKDWFKLLPWAAYSYNSSFHSAIGMTPFKAVFGRDPPSLLKYEPRPSDTPSLQEQLLQRDMVLVTLRRNLEQAQQRMKP
ncbi:uncharacterized protein [Arachis hypogaea]|uniref:uncharacterized protein n=1 Tax=Arachis hypogaea TaxID=3818 RepID=UPI003B20E35C